MDMSERKTIDLLVNEFWRLGFFTVSRRLGTYLPEPENIGKFRVDVIGRQKEKYAIGITLNIYQFIDEIAPTDNDYITTDYNPSGIIYEAQLTELYTPLYPIHHFVRVRAWKAGTKSSTITVTLYDAGVSVGSWIIVPTITPTNYEFALTSSEIAAITDYSQQQQG